MALKFRKHEAPQRFRAGLDLAVVYLKNYSLDKVQQSGGGGVVRGLGFRESGT